MLPSGSVGSMVAFMDAGFDLHTTEPDLRAVLHEAVEGGEEMTEYILGQ